jgi:hypothetical protein
MTELLREADPAVEAVLRSLTGPATAAELAAEADMVSAVTAYVTTGGGSVLSLVAALVAKKSAVAASAVLLGVGATGAAAATGALPPIGPLGPSPDTEVLVIASVDEIEEEPVVEEPVIEEPVIEEPVIEEPAVEEPADEEPVEEEPAPELTEGDDPDEDPKPECADHANHGHFVSATAHWATRNLEGRERGMAVSAAARNPCPRDAVDEGDDVDGATDPELQAAETGEDEAVPAASPTTPASRPTPASPTTPASRRTPASPGAERRRLAGPAVVRHHAVMDEDRERWDRRHAEHLAAPPAPPVGLADDLDQVPVAERGGVAARALDVACGQGSTAVWAARQGFAVLALDISPVALASAAELAERHGVAERITFVEHDLDDGLPSEANGPFELVVCQRFRHPPLYPELARRLAPGGLLVISVLSAVGSGKRPGPYHAPEGELVRAFGGLETVHAREGAGEATLVARRPAGP